MPPLQGQWLEALKPEFKKEYYKELFQKVGQEYQERKIFPAPDDIFNAFHFTPLDEVKVVILGQDPYHNDGQAHGLLFFRKKRVLETPPSLVNIYKELEDDMGCYYPKQRQSGKMGKTGRASFKHSADSPCPSANSHRGIGWEQFSRCRHPDPGRGGPSNRISSLGPAAQMKASMLHNPKHLILEAPHPSPLSAYRDFSDANISVRPTNF